MNDSTTTQGKEAKWHFRLYTAGQTPKSLAAISNLHRICEQYLPGCHLIEVIDLLTSPQMAEMDNVVALPTLVRKFPEPPKRLIGDLSNTQRVLSELGIDYQQGRPDVSRD